jgi:hypothetical protein
MIQRELRPPHTHARACAVHLEALVTAVLLFMWERGCCKWIFTAERYFAIWGGSLGDVYRTCAKTMPIFMQKLSADLLLCLQTALWVLRKTHVQRSTRMLSANNWQL